MVQKRRFTAHEKRIVAARQRWECGHCGTLLTASFEVDHVLALHLGGPDDYQTNAEALCKDCHAVKTQREEIERLRRLQRIREDRSPRPPLVCVRCARVVSPYFLHACP